MGTPVVGYDVPGTRDSVVDNKTGSLVPLGDIDAMAKKVIDLADQELYRRFSANALQWSKQFSWSQSVKKSLELLKKYAR